MSRIAPLAIALLLPLAAQGRDLVENVIACRALADTAARLACYDAMQLPAKAATAAPAASAVAVSRFGQETVRPAGAPPDLKRIESRLVGRFEGWRSNQQLALENGQVWRIADDSEALYELQNPKVIVHRGVLGAFFLEIEGVPFRVRVVRVR
jgi:hypothetical protein